jgi:hypothetical protein
VLGEYSLSGVLDRSGSWRNVAQVPPERVEWILTGQSVTELGLRACGGKAKRHNAALIRTPPP